MGEIETTVVRKEEKETLENGMRKDAGKIHTDGESGTVEGEGRVSMDGRNGGESVRRRRRTRDCCG